MADLADRTDNISLTNDAATKVVTITTDGAKERLDVAASIDGQVATVPFVPVMTFSVASTALAASPTWTTLLTVTAAGKLDFIAIAGSTDKYRVRITVDSVVVINITMSELSSIGLSNGTNVSMWTETANKNFRYHPDGGVDFTTNFTVEAQLESGSPTVNWMIHHRTS